MTSRDVVVLALALSLGAAFVYWLRLVEAKDENVLRMQTQRADDDGGGG